MRDGTRSLARALLAPLLALALGACGGGGGGSSPVTFTFETAAETLPEDAGPTLVTVVLHTTLAALAEDASVDVVDLGTGTASAGDDYVAFAPQTLTFPAGTLDGATQTVTLEPLDDALVDGAGETVRLRLQGAVGGKVSGVATFTATLEDLHTASVGFATAASATGDEGVGAFPVALELDCGPGVSLGVAVSVRVTDLRTGTARSPGDYAAFSARTVTFPAGTADGAVQTVEVTIADDETIEGDETVELGLSNPQPTACCSIVTGMGTHVLTIEDDDLEGPAAFAASEGPTGTGNPLAYDELVDLGVQVVGAGPNPGTLVRVSNLGGEDMQIAAPRVTGSHPYDFYVDVESTAALAVTGRVPVAGAPAPLAALAHDDAPGVAFAVDAAEVARLAALDEVALHALDLPGHGPATLELTRRPLPLAADARLVVDGADVPGGPRTLLGDLQLWSGTVAGVPGSRAFLALSRDGAQGFVDLRERGGLVHVLAEAPGRVRFVGEPELAALGAVPPLDALCAGVRLAPGTTAETVLGTPSDPSTQPLTIASCRLAIETDYQLWDKFDDTTNLTNYVTSLVAAVSDRYLTDVQVTLAIAYLGVHTTSDDGWETQEVPGADAGDLLDEFVAAWAPNSWPVEADLAHFLSGDGLGGGIAYINVLCRDDIGFAVSGNITGSINWAAWTGAPAPFTWDFVVVAHELGHNFGSHHTHDYCPPLDHCYTNCDGTTGCEQGTLMSYCHAACGGMIHIDLEFHPVTANVMRHRVNTSCLEPAMLVPGDFVQYRVRFNPLSSTGVRSSNLELDHDATNVTRPFRVRLQGTAQ